MENDEVIFQQYDILERELDKLGIRSLGFLTQLGNLDAYRFGFECEIAK